MGYWLKRFADGSEIRGTDRAVALRIASWSRSRLDGMVGVELEQHGFVLRIDGPGDFWQSDSYEAVFPGPGSTLIKRQIQRRIGETDTHFRCAVGDGAATVVFNGGLLEGGKWVPIRPSMRGQWLILEYDVRTRKARYYLRGSRI